MTSSKKKSNKRKPSNQKKTKPYIVVTFCVGLAILAGLAATFFIVKNKGDVVEVDLASLTEDAQSHQANDNHPLVVETLSGHLDEFFDDVATLKLFASSQLKVPEPGNLHVSKAIRVYRRIAELDPEDVDAHRNLFDLYSRTKDEANAMKFGQRLVKLAPKDYVSHLRLGQQLLDSRQWVRANEIADSVISASPETIGAYELRIRTMLASNADEAQILEFIARSAQANENKINRSDLLMIYAAETGNEDDFAKLMQESESASKTLEQTVWKINALESAGNQQDAMTILIQAVSNGKQTQLARGLAYRYLQRGQFEEAQNEIKQMAKQGALNDELLVLDALCKILNDERSKLEQPLELLKEKVSQFARSWHPILFELSQENPNTIELQRSCASALSFYPQSGYLYHCYALSFELTNESDLAIQNYRTAIRYTPRWAVPRISLGRLLLSKQQNELAFFEASSALQINPRLPAAFEIVLLSSMNIANQGQSFPESRLEPLCNTLAEIRDTTQDKMLKQIMQAAEMKLQGKSNRCDELLSKLVTESTKIESNLLRVIEGLATDAGLVAQIQRRSTEMKNNSLPYQIEQAIAAAQTKGLQAGLRFLDKLNFKSSDNPQLSKRLATAQLHAAVDSPKSMSLWLLVSKDYESNPRIQQLVLAQPVLANDRDAQLKVIERLKTCSNGRGVTWQLAEAKWKLAGDESQKTAAEVVIQLTNVLKQAPTSDAAYLLIAQAYDRLLQPQQALAALQTAVNQGITNPLLIIELAERLSNEKQNSMAAMHAYNAAISPLSSLTVKQRASVVLLQVESHQKAVDVMEIDMPEKLNDTDSDFQFFAAYVMAQTKLGKTTEAAAKMQNLAPNFDRWFELWINAATMKTTPLDHSIVMLRQAMSWSKNNDADRKSKIARAWSRIASREQKPKYYREAIEILTRDSIDALSPKLQFQLAAIYHRAKMSDKAMGIYKQLIHDQPSKTIRAAAQNNLAMLVSEAPDGVARGEQLARGAVKLVSRPEYIETLIKLLTKQNRHQDAVDLLRLHLESNPNSLLLQVCLAESLINMNDWEAANDAIAAAEKLRTVGTSLALWQRLNEIQKTAATAAETP